MSSGASNIGPRLSIMMFLEFFVWGAWYVTVGNYMKTVGMLDQIYWAYTVGPIAAIVSPFFLGLIADRFFATQRVLGVMHLLGGAAIIAAPMFEKQPQTFILLLLAHMLCYMPTIGLANTLAFHTMTNAEKQFPIIRVFGTLGWIAAGFLVSKMLGADAKPLPLQIAGAAGIVMGLYSFTLPNTPPSSAGKAIGIRQILGLDALSQLSSVAFWVFIASSLLICIPLSSYYAYAPVFADAAKLENPGFKMSFGQMSEVFFMLVMPLCFARLGVKWMLAVGMLAWVVRYGLFAAGATDGVMWMIVAGILLHGICYDFFFVTGYIYVDKKASPEIKGQAQGFVVLVTLGIGMLIGSIISGRIFNSVVGATGGLKEWQQFWAIPAIGAAAILLLFVLLFKDKSVDNTPAKH